MKNKLYIYILLLINFSIFNFHHIKTFSQDVDSDIIAIIDKDIEEIFTLDENNIKTVNFIISGIQNADMADDLNIKFKSFGGVKECNFQKSSKIDNVYYVMMKFYDKAHPNYFLKMLITYDINNVIYKGVLKRTDELKIKGEVKSNN